MKRKKDITITDFAGAPASGCKRRALFAITKPQIWVLSSEGSLAITALRVVISSDLRSVICAPAALRFLFGLTFRDSSLETRAEIVP